MDDEVRGLEEDRVVRVVFVDAFRDLRAAQDPFQDLVQPAKQGFVRGQGKVLQHSQEAHLKPRARGVVVQVVRRAGLVDDQVHQAPDGVRHDVLEVPRIVRRNVQQQAAAAGEDPDVCGRKEPGQLGPTLIQVQYALVDPVEAEKGQRRLFSNHGAKLTHFLRVQY